MKVLTVVSNVGLKYEFGMEDAEASALNLSTAKIEFTDVDGYSVRVEAGNAVFVALGEDEIRDHYPVPPAS